MTCHVVKITYVKARQDVKFYNEGKVQLGDTPKTEIPCPTIFLLYIPDPGIKLLDMIVNKIPNAKPG